MKQIAEDVLAQDDDLRHLIAEDFNLSHRATAAEVAKALDDFYKNTETLAEDEEDHFFDRAA